MTQEEKQLLLKDLCARLPYGVKCRMLKSDSQVCTLDSGLLDKAEILEPYLRPMSSMTNEEWCEYCDSCAEDEKEAIITHKGYRIVPTTHKEHFFNSHHFDYRSLIENGLALEAPKDMYKTE